MSTGFKSADQVLSSGNVINVNKNKSNNVINVNGGKYSLGEKFVPHTEETQLAEEMANKMNDLGNYAFYFSVVKTIGVSNSIRLLKVVLDEITTKEVTKTPVRNKGRYFCFIYKRRLY